MPTSLRILVVEDSEDDAVLLLEELRRGGYDPQFARVDTAEAMQAALDEREWDIIVSDYSMPRFSGLAALALSQERNLDVPFLLVSGTIGEDLAVSAMRAGASDYLMKDHLARLVPAVERELREAEVHRENRRTQETLRLQLLHSQKMEAVGRLAGGVAHDFNNLLTVITGFASIAKAALESDHPVRDDLHHIEEAAKRAGDLTSQLLAFARKQIASPQVLNPGEQIGIVEKILRRLIGEDIELVTVAGPESWRIRVDPGQFQQLLMNLVVNSRDAMPNGGKLAIEISNAAVDGEPGSRHAAVAAGEYVLIAVRDTGCGMSEEVLTQIFEPFFTTKGPGKGTGLGLSTCYGIVTQNRGTIRVESSPDEGTTFYVYLPRVAAGSEERRESSRSDVPTTGSETVLLVEDEPMVRELAARVLRCNGYTVLEACDAAEALELAQSRNSSRIDLLLTDVVMPKMSGRELAERLMPIRAGMKLLYVSGYTDDSLVHHGVLPPGAGFLQKPFTPDGLLRTVRQLLEA